MANSQYASTPETANTYRLSRILLGPCTDQLRDVLCHYIPTASFQHVLAQQRAKLPRLKAPQRELIFPSTGQYSGDYSDMDISLLYTLLRNICSIQPHSNGWGNDPEVTDVSLSACIERIREIRNRIGHAASTSLSLEDFNDYCADIKKSVSAIDKHLKNGGKYLNVVDCQLAESMDPEREGIFLNQLKIQIQEDTSAVQIAVNEIHGQGAAKRAKIEVIYTREPEENIKEEHINTDFKELRESIRKINESEADRIQVLPFKTKGRIEVEKFYVQMSMIDEYGKRNHPTLDEEKVPNISPEMMFNVKPNQPARYVFLLGEAGYGKTVQCQRIAKSWCQAWQTETEGQNEIQTQVSDLENCLKEFDFLFFVQMREVSDKHVSLIDIIQDVYNRYHLSKQRLDDIREVLKEDKFKSLVLLDGLDEWKISANKKGYLLDKCIPDCRDMPRSTILISMRSWKFLEVEDILRLNFDRVMRLNGLDEDGINELTNNVLSYHIWQTRYADETEFNKRSEKVLDFVSSASFELKSLMKIPLLGIFYIITLCEDIETGHSLTTFYLSMIEALIKKAFSITHTDAEYSTVSASGSSFPEILRKYSRVTKLLPDLLQLGKIAFENLNSEGTTLVFDEHQLEERLGSEQLNLFLTIGLITKQESPGKIHENNIRIIFLHRTIQEFLSALFLYQDRDSEILNSVSNAVGSIEKALEFSYVLTFLSGLDSLVGCKISNHIKELTNDDRGILSYREFFEAESYQKVFFLYRLLLRCYKEVRGNRSIETLQSEPYTFWFSDIILLANDTDKMTIRESAKVLKFHPNTVISLNIVCIPDDKDDGITNAEINDFLNASQSIKSLYIDGYIDGTCRLLNEKMQRMSSLQTLGLANVSFASNILSDLLMTEEAKKGISALGLLYLKSPEDLSVDFHYQIPSIHWKSTKRSGFIRKTRSLSPNSSSLLRAKKKVPFLTTVLEILPMYKSLSTLYITYLESADDRQTLRRLMLGLGRLKTLNHFGYRGSLISPESNDEYDASVIVETMKLQRLRKIHIRDIRFIENVMNFENMSSIERIWLGNIEMKSDDWRNFFKSVLRIGSLQRVVLFDTNIEGEVFDECIAVVGDLNVENIESTLY